MVTFADISGNVDLNGQTFSDLAQAGDKGVIVALIIALIVLMVIFAIVSVIGRWFEIRRYERKEIKRDQQLAAMKIEENDSRIKLAQTQQAITENIETLTKVVETTSERLNDNILDVRAEVKELSHGVNAIKTTVEKNTSDIQRHEGILQTHTGQFAAISAPKLTVSAIAPKRSKLNRKDKTVKNA